MSAYVKPKDGVFEIKQGWIKNPWRLEKFLSTPDWSLSRKQEIQASWGQTSTPLISNIYRLKKNRSPDKFEKENESFFNRLRNVYLDLARQHPNRYKIINANQAIQSVSQDVIEAIKTKIGRAHVWTPVTL